MEVIVGDKGKGKTTKLIRESIKNNGIIVCLNEQRVTHVVSEIQKMYKSGELHIQLGKGIEPHRPITYEEFFKNYAHGMRNDSFYFDDLDQWLELQVKHKPIAAVAISGRAINLL